MVIAAATQNARFAPPAGDRWASRAGSFRLDPRRNLEANTAAVLALVQPGDSVLDVGGGAGRVGLPVALHCREVTNVEPSEAMRREFEASALEAGIRNARAVAGGWPEAAAGLAADVVMVANVTYFVRDIVPFVRALDAAARRRVIISVWSVPPPNHGAPLFELIHEEPLAPAPSYRELLPVLWDLGILPDVQVLPDPFRGARERPPTREDAIRMAIQRAGAEHLPDAAETVEAHFDELFAAAADGFVPKWTPRTREMLITWSKA
jgi:SAM-dependent methyltransferase